MPCGISTPSPTSFLDHCTRFFKTTTGTEKSLKLFKKGVFPLTLELAKAFHASEESLARINRGRSVVNITADAVGFGRIFRGVIPGLYRGGKSNVALAKALLEGKEEHVLRSTSKIVLNSDNLESLTILGKTQSIAGNSNIYRAKAVKVKFTTNGEFKTKKYVTFNQKAVGRREMITVLARNTFQWIGGFTFLIGFGLSRPISRVESWGKFRSSNRGVQEIGGMFSHLMFLNHVSALAENILNISYQTQALEREISKNTSDDDDEMYREYERQVVASSYTIAEKSLELVMDGLNYARVAKLAPAWFSILVEGGSASLGFYKVWREA